jgi:transcriptional regulator with XRE-family HTH domain
MSTFAKRLQHLASVKKIDQVDIAKGLQTDRSTVNRWWTGKVVPGPKNIRKLRDFFGCDYEWIEKGIGVPFRQVKEEGIVSSGEFERRKTDKVINEKLARIERAVFKTQCPGYLDDLFDFIADKYRADKEGVEAFLEETSKTNPKFKDWLREKKRKGEGSLSDEQQCVQNGE